MRILYFSPSYTPHDFRFLSAIVEGGYQAHFLRLNEGKSSESRPLPLGAQSESGSLSDVIAKVKPDLLHAGPLTDCGYQAAKDGFHPLVLMSWGSDILWEARRHRASQKRIRYALDRADVVIGDCNVVQQAAMRFGVSSHTIITFPWGVDLSRFSPSAGESGLRKTLGWQKAFVLLHLRAWEPLYDPLTVVRAFVRASRENTNLRLMMPGDGSQRARIKQILEKAGLRDRVHFPGQISQKELPAYFCASDIYLSASQSDGSSVSLMEGLACGLPALVSDIPGNREWIQPGKQGWLFPVKDVTALNQLILKASNSKRLKVIARQARKLAEQKANWAKNKGKLFAAYQLALESTD